MTHYLTDRTSIETDWKCPMAFWWYRLHGGTGIVPVEEASYYKHGRMLHADYAALASGASVESLVRASLAPILASDPTQVDLEQGWWHASMVAAYGTFVLPKWLEHYDPILIEKELVLHREPLQVANTADLVLKGKPDSPTAGQVIVADFKSVKWVSPGWVSHWPFAVQMQINPKAVEEATGEKVKSTIVMGVQKGDVRGGKLRHPYIYGYRTESGDKWSADWKASPWYLDGLWERDGAAASGLDTAVAAVVGWVVEQGEQAALSLHPTSAPILENPRLLNRLIEQRTRREAIVAEVKDRCQTDLTLRDTHFPQSFTNCRSVIGSPCAYLGACHNAEVEADPIGSGMYVARTPHHDVEWLERESGE